MSTAAKKVPAKKPVEKKGPVAVPAPQPEKPSAIANRAMLVSVTVHRWKPLVTDDVVSAKVAQDHGADRNVGKYRKRLFAKKTFFDTASVENEIRREFWDRTLPWSDDRGRILLNVGYLPFVQKMQELTAKFDTEWKKVIPNEQAYKDLKAEAKSLYGSLYDEKLYPPYEEAIKKFGVTIRVGPIPSGEDFRVDVGDKETDRIRREIDEESKHTIEEAMKTVWGRLRDVVEHMVKRLNAYAVGEDGKVQNTFRDSVVTNVTELLDLLPSLNVTQDAALAKFEKDIRAALVQHSGTVLRDDEKLRKETAKKAEEILGKMGAYFA